MLNMIFFGYIIDVFDKLIQLLGRKRNYGMFFIYLKNGGFGMKYMYIFFLIIYLKFFMFKYILYIVIKLYIY